MRHFLSGHILKGRFGTAFATLLFGMGFLSVSIAQQPFPTSRADNTRSNANTSETLLTPSSVNKSSFGLLFTAPVDNVVMAQPLYIPNVSIAGQVHNVVYVTTMADSVYAFDADTGAQLWWVNFTNPAQGITTAQVNNAPYPTTLPCGLTQGFAEEGIVGTPVIDTTSNIMYLVAKTVLNNVTVQHHLHALDITTGNDVATPVLITANSISNLGHKTTFNSLHQKNRPGLLLLNGTIYIGFGSNSCNDDNSGWVLSYNEATLAQTGIFNTSPDQGLTSIWQAGSGLTADDEGNIFFETAEAANNKYDIYEGGQTYSNSVVKITPGLVDENNQYLVADYFTPWNVAYLNSNDFDLSSTGAIALPDQTGAYTHELIAGGKYGMAYVINRDDMGQFSPGADSQIIQEIALVNQPNPPNDVLFGSPAYWNGNVYFAPDAAPLMAFPVLPSGLLGAAVETGGRYSGSHSPSISANGNTNGIMWVISGGLNAFNACTSPNPCQGYAPMQLLYNSNQAPNGRDKLGTPGHFVTQTVANGKVYVAAEMTTSPATYALEVYGLFHAINITSGAAQSAPVATAEPNPITINIASPYSGVPDVGAEVTISDGGKGGTFNPPSPLYTDVNGNVSTTYTVPSKVGTYTLTATLVVNGSAASSIATTATAVAGTPTKIVAYGGSLQHDSNGATIGVTPGTKPLVAEVEDAKSNPVAGVTVYFTATKGAIPNPSSAITNAKGMASINLQLPSTASTINVTACLAQPCGSAKNIFIEYSVKPVATTISISSGNNQSDSAGAQLPQPLAVLVTDQYGNPMSRENVTFTDNGAGGSFSNGATVATGANGIASDSYTLPSSGVAVTIDATAAGLSSPAVFTENAAAQTATKITVVAGSYQTAAAGTQLPVALTVQVVDQYGNPVAGNLVTFSDNGAGGSFPNGNTAATGANGEATANYSLPTSVTNVTINATAAGVATPAIFSETGIAGPAANLAIASGNYQTAPNGTTLPQPLVVLVTDQYNNPVSGVTVGFNDSGAGGTFSNPNPGVTGANGQLSQIYILPAVPSETVTIYVSAGGIGSPILFTEYGQ